MLSRVYRVHFTNEIVWHRDVYTTTDAIMRCTMLIPKWLKFNIRARVSNKEVRSDRIVTQQLATVTISAFFNGKQQLLLASRAFQMGYIMSMSMMTNMVILNEYLYIANLCQ